MWVTKRFNILEPTKMMYNNLTTEFSLGFTSFGFIMLLFLLCFSAFRKCPSHLSCQYTRKMGEDSRICTRTNEERMYEALQGQFPSFLFHYRTVQSVIGYSFHSNHIGVMDQSELEALNPSAVKLASTSTGKHSGSQTWERSSVS